MKTFGEHAARGMRGMRVGLRTAASVTLALGAATTLSLLGTPAAGAAPLLPAGTNIVGSCATAALPGHNFTGPQPISAAVAATSAGGTVYICAGTWADNVTVTTPMTIEGAGQGSTIVVPEYSNPNGYDNTTNLFSSTVFLVQADDVTIQDLTINGSNPSAVTANPWTAGATCDTTWAAYGEDGPCIGVTFNAGAGIDTGIPASAVTGMTVQDVTVENVYQLGIANRSFGGTFDFSNDTISVLGYIYSQGIFTYEANGTMSDDSVSWANVGLQSNWGAITVTGNTVTHANWGIFMGNIGEPAGDADGGSTTVDDNTVSDCWGQSFFAGATNGGDSELGVAFFAPFAPTAETASGNAITGCSTGLADFSTNNDEPGTYATPVVTFSDNVVNGANASGGIGALVSTDKLGYENGPVDAQFTDNAISGYPTALYTDETNLDDWAGTDDPSLPGGLTVSASGNQFDGGWTNDAQGTISATDNWWGSPSGPSVSVITPDTESASTLIARAAPTWWTTANEHPSAPRSVTATRGNGQVTVRWSAPTYTGSTDPSVTVTGYTATASPGGASCTTTLLTCTVTGLTNGTVYSFTVTASNSIGASVNSSAASATPATTPSAPRAVAAAASNASVSVSWTAPASNGGSTISSYTVTATPGNRTCTTSTLDCTVTGLTNGTTYSFSVVATNGVGPGPASSSVSAKPVTTPSAPQDVMTVAGNGSVAVSWGASASDGGLPIESYTVTAQPGDETCTTTGLGCTVTGLTNGTTYSLTVAATTAQGTGAASAPVSVVPLTNPTAPQSVVAHAGNRSVTVAWAAPASDGGSAILNYAVTASPGGQGCGTTSLSCTVYGLTNGTAYTFTVVATNLAGPSPASSAATATPVTLPTAPRHVVADARNAAIAVSWLAPASDGGSAITKYTVSGTGGKSCTTTGALSCVVTGLTNGTSYRFTVRASTAVGTGPASTQTPARTPAGPATIKPFALLSSTLTVGLKDQIQTFARLTSKDGFTTVSLVGYTNPGEPITTETPAQLGLARAAAVGTYLAAQLKALGVSGVTITESYGGTATIAASGSPANRRVVATGGY